MRYECGLPPRFPCHVCGRFFRRKDDLQRHIARIHGILDGAAAMLLAGDGIKQQDEWWMVMQMRRRENKTQSIMGKTMPLRAVLSLHWPSACRFSSPTPRKIVLYFYFGFKMFFFLSFFLLLPLLLSKIVRERTNGKIDHIMWCNNNNDRVHYESWDCVLGDQIDLRFILPLYTCPLP